jgi:putative membrane protein
MIRPLLLAAGLSISLGACASETAMPTTASAPRDMTPPASMAGDMTPTDRAGYVQMAAASDLFEMQSSNLARTRAQSPDVRQFAEMMIADHTQTTAQLTAAANAAGTPPDPRLLPMQVDMMNQLQGASAADFDRVYMTQQVQAHEMALALHSNYARSGDNANLRSVAATATPIIEHHLGRARQLAG